MAVVESRSGLMRVFDFDENDLKDNRRGRLTKTQQSRLREQLRQAYLIQGAVLIGGLVVGLIVLFAVGFRGSTATFRWGRVVAVSILRYAI